MKLPVRLLLTLSTTLLAACGGGGGDAGVAPTVTNFPLLAGYKVLTAAGATNNYTVTGSCSGTATIADSAAVAAAFEGINGYSTTSNATINVPNCTPASNSSTSTSYYDTNYTPLGSSTPGSEYAKVVAAPPSLPASVKVGDAGAYASFTIYADSSKTTVTGSRVFSYVVEADTLSTAIVNVIAKDYDTSNQLILTQQSRYRIAADGKLTSTSIDAQYSTTSISHFVLTKI